MLSEMYFDLIQNFSSGHRAVMSSERLALFKIQRVDAHSV